MDWQRIEPTVQTKVGFRTITTKTFRLPDGTKDFQTFNKESTHNAGVVALTRGNEVIITEQYRPGPEKIMQEIPGGMADPGDIDYCSVALREFAEETGYSSNDVSPLGSIYKDAYNNNTWHFFLALNCDRRANLSLDSGEFVTVKLISIEQFIENARNGLMTDTEAVFLAYDKLRELQNSI